MFRRVLALSTLMSLSILSSVQAAQNLLAEASWNFLYSSDPSLLIPQRDTVGGSIWLSGNSGVAGIDVFSLYGRDAASRVLLRREQTFDAFASMLTNGEDDMLSGMLQQPFNNLPAPLGRESEVFGSVHRLTAAPDLAGHEIEKIEFTLRNHFESPGQNLTGNGVWTDGYFDASLKVFGVPVATPAPDLMGSYRFAFGGFGTANVVDPVRGVLGFETANDVFTLPPVFLETGGEDVSVVLTSGAAFDRLVTFLSDGVDGRLTLDFSAGCCAGGGGYHQSESSAASGLSDRFDGVDFAGATISRIEIDWRNLIDSPGLDYLGDGKWTDVEGRVTINVYGSVAAVPEPATALQTLAGIALMGAVLAARRVIAPQCVPKLS